MMKSRMRWVGHVTQMGEKRNASWLLVGKPKGNIPLGRPRCRWVNNIKRDLGKIGWGAQYRDKLRALVKVVMSLWFP
jgi:hypothetical protein